MIDYEYIGALQREIEKMNREELLNKKHECEAKRSEYGREKNFHAEQISKYMDYIEQEIALIEHIKRMMLKPNKEVGK